MTPNYLQKIKAYYAYHSLTTDNGFKQVQITYLAVISNSDKLVQLSYNACHFDLRLINLISTLINGDVYVNNFHVQSVLSTLHV